MPIIDLQRRLMEAGRIRAGDQVAYEKDGETKYRARKLAEWRLTSKDRQRLDRAAELWGGTVQPWEGRDGEWELYTSTDQLPIMLIPGSAPTTWYELWSKGGCQRRCDGQHEIISDSPCLCGDDRECKPTTRLSVLLPDLRGVGSWLLQSTGWNAAAELAGGAELLGRASAQGVLIPARLRLEQRVDVKAGQTRRYAVPAIDVDVSFRDLLGGGMAPSALEAPGGYVPIPPVLNAGTTLRQGLEAAETATITRTGRSAAPLPDVEARFDAAPVPADDVPFGEPPPEPIPGQETLPVDEPDKPATPKDALNVVYNILQREGHVTVEQMYASVASARSLDGEVMVELIDGRKKDGSLSWARLRDSLYDHEIAGLLDRLRRYEQHLAEHGAGA